MIATAAGRAHAAYEFYPEAVAAVCTEMPVARLAVTYVLLAPLLLFAVHGGFSFEHYSWNSELGAHGGKMAMATTASEALRDRLQTLAALSVCVTAMAGHIRRITATVQAVPLLLLLPVYAICSSLWSQDPGTSLRSGLSLLVTTLFAIYLVVRFNERQQLELFILVGAVMAALNLAMALVWPQAGSDHQMHEGALQGLFTQKNACAESTLFLLSPALAFSARSRYGQLLRVAYVSICLLIIFMTRSQTGWAIALLYLGFAATLHGLARFGRKEVLPLAGLWLCLAGTAIAVAITYPGVLLSLMGRSEGLSGRITIWSAVLTSILRRPLTGFGFDAFWSNLEGESTHIFAATGWVVSSAHNGFLNLTLELGLIGLGLVVLTFVLALRRAWAAFRPGHTGYVEWCIGILFLTIVYNLDERTLMATQYLPWILYIVACAGLQKAAQGTAEPASRPHLAEAGLER